MFVLGISTTLFNGTLHKTLVEHINALPWIERFNGGTFVGKCPSGIAPNRLEAQERIAVPVTSGSEAEFSLHITPRMSLIGGRANRGG